LSTTNPTWPDLGSNSGAAAVGSQRLTAWAMARQTTSNYSTNVNSHTLQFTAAHTRSSQSAVFSSRSLVSTSNGRRFWTIPVPQLPASNSNTSQRLNCGTVTNSPTISHFTVLTSTELASLIVLLVTSRHGPHRKHRTSVAVLIVTCAVIGAGRTQNTVFQSVHWGILWICCLANGVFLVSLLSNGSICYNIYVILWTIRSRITKYSVLMPLKYLGLSLCRRRFHNGAI
jgi:hypothetical protein